MPELHDLTVAQASERIAKRELSPVDLVEALLSRIERLEPQLGAWARVTGDVARAEAKVAQDEIERSGPKSPLHGIPVGLKDIIDTAGILTEGGSDVLEGRVPDADAHCVVKLREAGAVMLGKTTTTEFAGGHPSAAKNPWNAAHTPAGSSSGSGVAVAARMVPAALGTQTVGSVLRPGAYNGCVGFKPTFGRIGRTGVIWMAYSLDHVGTLTRSVEDAALMLQAMAGHDPNDPDTHDAPLPDFRGELGRVERPRIGLVRRFFQEESEPETWAALERVANDLAEAGATVEEVDSDLDFGATYAHHRVVQESEMLHAHQAYWPERRDLYKQRTREYLEAGEQHSAITYIEARRVQRDTRAKFHGALRDCDALLLPTASSPAPANLTNTGDTRFQSFFTFTGLPSISIPMGLASNGLPVAAQFVAPQWHEAHLFAVAQWAESVLDVDLNPLP